MPQYLYRKDHTYYFRQGIPAELRALIGKREIKKSLGSDYVRAVRECKRYAVIADNLLAEARAKLDSIPVDPYSAEGIRRTRLVPVTGVTPEFERQFANLTQAALLETDQQRRLEGLGRQAFEEYGREIDASITALRRQLAMGDVSPMLGAVQTFLVGRGYDPELSEPDWRRLAYAMTQASLEAYEEIARRQQGQIVKEPQGERLASQYELQNTPKVSRATQDAITWEGLYAVWQKECERRQHTQDAYLAAMKLFQRFCAKPPQAVTREDALAYRDYLRDTQQLAPGTVANKLGFVGTLINAGRNHADYARYLPFNPFGDIKVKESKRGKADTKRQPFSDGDLQAIFGSSIYTGHERPAGGAGEAAAWIPAIAYLTGMRLEEIGLLQASQFKVDAKGTPYIHTEDGKNENSADRDIPLHPMLLQAGLLAYAQTCQGRLFPKIKSADEAQTSAYSKWFGRHLDSLGITGRAKVFHSFRHLFKDLCRNAGLDDSAIDQVCGHEPGTVGGRYGKGRRIDVLADLLAKVEPPVLVPRIYPRDPKTQRSGKNS